MWTITKQFDFCYGHRVWSQKLDENLSLDNKCKCRHLHGHQGVVHIALSSLHLTDGMVTDFKHLNWFKKWLDDNLDHKFIMDIEDPLFPILFPKVIFFGESQIGQGFQGLMKPHCPTLGLTEIEWELYEGLVLVPFIPTSENLAFYLHRLVADKMHTLCTVESVRFEETPKSSSTYSINL